MNPHCYRHFNQFRCIFFAFCLHCNANSIPLERRARARVCHIVDSKKHFFFSRSLCISFLFPFNLSARSNGIFKYCLNQHANALMKCVYNVYYTYMNGAHHHQRHQVIMLRALPMCECTSASNQISIYIHFTVTCQQWIDSLESNRLYVCNSRV